MPVELAKSWNDPQYLVFVLLTTFCHIPYLEAHAETAVQLAKQESKEKALQQQHRKVDKSRGKPEYNQGEYL